MVAQIDREFVRANPRKIYTRLISYALYEGRPLTTKGRWFNWFVFKWLKLQEYFPWPRKVEKPIFILGTGRSGTTILGITLAVHKDVGFLNEPKALWSSIIPNEDVIGSYQHTVLGQYRLHESDIDPTMIKKFHRILGNYLKFSMSNRLVDKYPELLFRIEAVLKVFPDAKFLFLYRNGLDTCHSIKKWSESNNQNGLNKTVDWWGKDNQKWTTLCSDVLKQDDVLKEYAGDISKFNDHFEMAAVEWVLSMKEGLKLLKRYPDQVKAIKYEDYVSDIESRSQILEFCELEECSSYTRYCDAVLSSRPKNLDVVLPKEIQSEFNRVMIELGYE